MVREQLCGSAAILHPDHARGGPAASLKMQLESPTGQRALFQRPRLGSVGPLAAVLRETDRRTRVPSAAFSEGPQHVVSKRPVCACLPLFACLLLMSVSRKCLYSGLFLKWNHLQPVKMNE